MADERRFVPAGFEPVTHLTIGPFRLEPLGPQHNDRDYAAWMSSIDYIRSLPGFPDGRWPEELPLEQNLSHLERHAREFAEKRGFTYTVLDSDDDVVGCVYIFPDTDGVHDAYVQSWLRESKAAHEEAFRRDLAAWLVGDDWPFARPRYEPLLD
ncbi:MAG TPA: hypothetical protein VG899_06170 [Mycobacteriales bacterium]|nr:hypothetical protein [Mycobacteriales bacterium]